MVHRSLDVIFQYLPRLAAALLLIPLAAGSVFFALDRSQVVSARVWADRPLFTPDFASDRFSNQDSPADIEASLMQEVISTDVFVGKVLAKVEPTYGSWSGAHRAQAAADLRANVTVVPQGAHLFVINYRSTQPDHGAAVITAVVDVFSTTVQEFEAIQLGSTQTALQAELDTAKQSMSQAVATAQTYQAAHRLDDRAAALDPNYATLVAQAKSQTDRYLTVLAQVDEAQATSVAVVELQQSLFHVVDPPTLVARQFGRSTPGVKQFLEALAGIAALETVFVYVVARRDPSIRSVEDVRRELGLKPLGSVPVLGAR